MLSAPEPITSHHVLDEFNSGVATLDTWLKKRALQNQASGASRCFVLCEDRKVIGYYALAASAVAPAATSGSFRRNMPDPIPVVVLGRLAIDSSQQGKGFGRALFQDAARRVINAADTIGIRGLLVHALSEEAKAFYLRLGLDESPLEPMALMTTVANLQAALGPE
jgi:GNAT superfamily N-acetyltransferase